MKYVDYYQIIDLEPTATSTEIEQAYRTLARKYHPDTASEKDDDAVKRFGEINEARAVLADLDRRMHYDKLSQTWKTHVEKEDTEPFDWSQWATNIGQNGSSDEGAELDYSEFFKTIFCSPKKEEDEAVSTNGKKPKRREYVQKLQISLEEGFKGTTRVLKVGQQTMKVKIPKGAKTGTKIRLKGKQIQLHKDGEEPSEQTKGDLFLEIELLPHPVFKVEGNDLLADLPVDLYTAVLGGEAVVPNLGKGKVKLKIPNETQPGRTFRLKGLGMPLVSDPDERGDLLIKAVVSIPQKLTPEEVALFEELADLRGL